MQYGCGTGGRDFMTSSQLPAVAEPGYLTAALRKAGALDAGAVREVKVLHERDTVVSHITRLGLRYVGESSGAPQTLILKTSHADFAKTLANGGRHEVAFYTKLAPKMPRGLVLRCFDGRFDEEGSNWHLLLEDLTDSHELATVPTLPPSRDQSMAIVTTLAGMHAAWWDHPDLGETVGTWASPRTARNTWRSSPVIMTALPMSSATASVRSGVSSTAVSSSSRRGYPSAIIRAATSRLPTAMRIPGISCCRVPASRTTVRIFDFDLWGINVPTDDLAYMMAIQWYPDRRQALERALLNRYHETLLAHGVAGYTRGALDQDYRWSVLWHITKPVWQWSINIPPGIWWNNLERVMMAVEDLGCEELL